MTRTVGRPLKYKNIEEIQSLFDNYKNECKKNGKILTKAGLMISLDMDRQTYSRYREKKGFSDTINKINLEIEESWNQKLAGDKQATGAIFYLKNAFKEDYKDRTETDITSKDEKISGINYIVPKE